MAPSVELAAGVASHFAHVGVHQGQARHVHSLTLRRRTAQHQASGDSRSGRLERPASRFILVSPHCATSVAEQLWIRWLVLRRISRPTHTGPFPMLTNGGFRGRSRGSTRGTSATCADCRCSATCCSGIRKGPAPSAADHSDGSGLRRCDGCCTRRRNTSSVSSLDYPRDAVSDTDAVGCTDSRNDARHGRTPLVGWPSGGNEALHHTASIDRTGISRLRAGGLVRTPRRRRLIRHPS